MPNSFIIIKTTVPVIVANLFQINNKQQKLEN